MLDRIEVYRGNAPFDADRLGLGGAIFLEPAIPRRSRLGAGGALGSFGENGLWAAGEMASERGSFSLTLRRDAARNDYRYTDDAGTRFDASDDRVKSRLNADSESYDGWGVGRLALSPRARVLAVTNVFAREQGVTGLSAIPARFARLRTVRGLAAISTKFPCSSGEDERCEIELVTTGLASSAKLDDPLLEAGVGSTEVRSEGGRLSQQERVRYRFDGGTAFTLASSQESERLAIDNHEGDGLRARRESGRVAGTVSGYLTSKVQWVALGALDCNVTTGGGKRSGCDTNASGRIGFNVTPWPGVSLLANAGRYVRVPTLGELYGLSAALHGNPNLVDETGFTFDVGARVDSSVPALATSRVSLEAFAFRRDASQLVGYRRSSIGAATPYNVGTARIYGLEMNLAAELLRALRFELSLTATDPRDTTPSRAFARDLLPFRARLVVSPLCEVYLAPAQPVWGLDRISLGARLFIALPRSPIPRG